MAPSPRALHTAAHPRGIALIIVLVVMALMTVIVSSMMYQTRMELQMVRSQRQATQAYYMARSGLWRAINLLREDMLKDNDAIDDSDMIEFDDDELGLRYDSYYETWGSNLDLLEDIPVGPRDIDEDTHGTFAVRVLDEASRINLNALGVPLLSLQRLIEMSNVPEEEAAMIAAAIIDWRDQDDQVTLPEEMEMDLRDYGDQESEITFYNPEIDPRDLEMDNTWLPMKNDVFDTVGELLMVPGMDYFVLFGEDKNNNGELDDVEDDGSLNLPYDNEDGELQLGISEFLTVHSYAKTNLNTAPFDVIEALLFADMDKEAEDAAEKIVRERNGRDRILGTDDDEPFVQWEPGEGVKGKTVSELELPDGLLGTLQNVFTVSSDVFRVVSTGRIGDTERQITVIVSRDYYEEEELLDLYQYVFDELGEESPDIDNLTPQQREQVKFLMWEWDDYSLVDFRREED